MNTAGNAKPAKEGAMAGSTGQRAKNNQSSKTYCTPHPIYLSSLLDQALHRAELHSQLAEYHQSQAQKHRAILRSLQQLIPPGRAGGEV